MLRFKVPIVFFAILPAVLSCQAQTSASEPASPVFQSNAQAVSIDVVVTRGGEAVTGLGKRDFQVLEDGKPEAIDLFEERSGEKAPSVAAAQLPPHVFTNLPAASGGAAADVLLLDSLNTPAEDQAYVRRQVEQFLAGIPPGERIAVYALDTRLRLVQDFTADPALLKAAAAAAMDGKAAAGHLARTRNDDLRDKEELEIIGEMSATGGADSGLPLRSTADLMEARAAMQGGQRSSITLAALQQLARALSAVPGRKNVIWFARTFPVSIYPNGPAEQTLADGREMGEAVRATAGLLTEAHVALYPVSAQGVTIDRTTEADSGGQPQGDNFEKNPLGETAANDANRAAMEQLAHDTGGEAFYSGNDLGKSIAHAIEDGSHYYTLVYTPPGNEPDGKFHRIEVKLTAPEMRTAKLDYRRGYFAQDAAKPAANPLPALLGWGLPAATQVVYEARVLPLEPQPDNGAARMGGNTRLEGKVTRYKLDFVINPFGLRTETGADGRHTGMIEIALIAYDKDGHPLNWTGKTLPMNLNAAAYEQVIRYGISTHLQVDLPAAAAEIVTGVYEPTARRAGTLTLPIAADTAVATFKPGDGRLKLEKPAPPQ